MLAFISLTIDNRLFMEILKFRLIASKSKQKCNKFVRFALACTVIVIY